MYACSSCGGVVEASHAAGDPAVVCGSLGGRPMHWHCFKKAAEDRRRAEAAREAETKERRREAGRRAWALRSGRRPKTKDEGLSP